MVHHCMIAWCGWAAEGRQLRHVLIDTVDMNMNPVSEVLPCNWGDAQCALFSIYIVPLTHNDIQDIQTLFASLCTCLNLAANSTSRRPNETNIEGPIF